MVPDMIIVESSIASAGTDELKTVDVWLQKQIVTEANLSFLYSKVFFTSTRYVLSRKMIHHYN